MLARYIIACYGEDRKCLSDAFSYNRNEINVWVARTDAELDDALPFLKVAEKDYHSLTMLPAARGVLYVKAIIHNRLGDIRVRDDAAKEYMAVGQEQRN